MNKKTKKILTFSATGILLATAAASLTSSIILSNQSSTTVQNQTVTKTHTIAPNSQINRLNEYNNTLRTSTLAATNTIASFGYNINKDNDTTLTTPTRSNIFTNAINSFVYAYTSNDLNSPDAISAINNTNGSVSWTITTAEMLSSLNAAPNSLGINSILSIDKMQYNSTQNVLYADLWVRYNAPNTESSLIVAIGPSNSNSTPSVSLFYSPIKDGAGNDVQNLRFGDFVITNPSPNNTSLFLGQSWLAQNHSGFWNYLNVTKNRTLSTSFKVPLYNSGSNINYNVNVSDLTIISNTVYMISVLSNATTNSPFQLISIPINSNGFLSTNPIINNYNSGGSAAIQNNVPFIVNFRNINGTNYIVGGQPQRTVSTETSGYQIVASFSATSVSNTAPVASFAPNTQLISIQPIPNSGSSSAKYLALYSNGVLAALNQNFGFYKVFDDLSSNLLGTSNHVTGLSTFNGFIYVWTSDSSVIVYTGSPNGTYVGTLQYVNLSGSSFLEPISPIVFKQTLSNDLKNQPYSYFSSINWINPAVQTDFFSQNPAIPSIQPSYQITPVALPSNKNDGTLTLQVSQQLRQISYVPGANGGAGTYTVGQNAGVQSTVDLGTVTYHINNLIGSVTLKDYANTAPLYILNNLPSYFANNTNQIAKYFLDIKNITQYTISVNPNDTLGTMSVTVNVPVMWEVQPNSTTPVRLQNKSFTFKISGLIANPNAGVDENVQLVTNSSPSLISQFSGIYPSQLSAPEVLSNFVKLSPFMASLKTPTIQIYPNDSQGDATVRMEFSEKWLNQTVYTWTLPQVFRKNPFATNAAEFNFKLVTTDSNIMAENPNTYVQANILRQSPSQIQTLVQNNLSNITTLIYMSPFLLSNYVNTSNADNKIQIYFKNVNDYVGSFELTVVFPVSLPGYAGKTSFSNFFSGFKSQLIDGNIQNDNIGVFSFHSQADVSNANPDLFKQLPLAVLLTDANKFFSENFFTSTLTQYIKFNPDSINGTLTITVTFPLYVSERNKLEYNVSFEKTFIGFEKVSNEKALTYSFAWFTADQLTKYQFDSPSKIQSDIENKFKLYQNGLNQPVTDKTMSSTELFEQTIGQFAQFSVSAKAFLINNPSDYTLAFVPNDVNGTLKILFNVNNWNGNLKLQTFSTTITGLKATTESFSPSFITEGSSNLAYLQKIVPSQITTSELLLFFSIPEVDNNFTKIITTKTDDYKGVITVQMTIIPTQTSTVNQGKPIVSKAQEFSGFKKIPLPNQEGTNKVAVGASIGVTAGVMVILSGIALYYMANASKKLISKIRSKIEQRLEEEVKKAE